MNEPRMPEESDKIDSEIRDADGHLVSKGKTLFFAGETANFYPGDSASKDSILNRSRSLFLSEEKRSLALSSITPCPQEEIHKECHFHLRFSN